MSQSNDSDPKEPTEHSSSASEDVERPESDAQEEPPTEKLPAADDETTVLPAADDETTVLPAVEHDPAGLGSEPPPAERDVADETTVLPAVEPEGADLTEELPAPAPTEATTELPVAEQGRREPDQAEQSVSDETAVLPPAAAGAAAVTTGGASSKGHDADDEPGAAPGSRPSRFGLKTAVLSLVVLLLLGVVGVLGGELVARHLLAVCADEAAENVLHTKAKVDYDHSKFLLASLLDHEIPYLSVDAKNSAVDKYDRNGEVQLKEAIKGLDIIAHLEDVHVTKGGGSVGHMTTQVTWTAEGIRQTLANRDLKDPGQTESPITSVNSVKLDPEHNQFDIDVNGKIGILQARAVIIVQPEVDKQHNLQIRIKSIDLPEAHNFIGFDVSGFANSIARPAIEQVAKKVASYPMGLKAKSVQVKQDSIVFQFYADDAPLVKGTKCSALRWLE
ncbi:LmeA family phospholipid-binding protein [Segniliparus rugosus]|uniref:DUF2993 domain-containing protein n=1 Tax=Segniliparus rugosus (strain ATCC BAA-974 / DSM 45345 / CCUG 50838 / CIP 108380 / JCM 13579 / CDC 945) TaxID=679197 RepID=E5XTD5_SEGRC|nr:LmeA family phospholipid-binding protein [Segniliparus rugosus]EFV12397.1 hypothetical protein HMPREF9336_02757 [Segniliparus rugosus ATCC BAA-974]